MNTQDQMKPTTPTAKRVKSIIGIVIALGLIIAAGIMQANSRPYGSADITVSPINPVDHIRGNLEAPVQVIEYSDLECPFCKSFHATMLKVFADLGPQNEIVWAYRQYPIDSLHRKARTESIAAECVGKVGGNEAFWKMTDTIFTKTPSNDGLDLNTLPALAQESGVTRSAFLKCFNAKETAAKVEADLASGAIAGAKGTPYTLVISPKGNVFPIPGAYNYDQVVEIIERASKDK